LKALEIGSAFVSVAPALPRSAIVINRALGLGLSGPASRADVDAIVGAYQDAGVARYFLQIHPRARPGELSRWIEDAGLRTARGWQKFSRSRQRPEERRTDLEVREAGPGDGQAFGRIVCEAFDLGGRAVPWLAELPGRARWHIFMSFSNGKAAGTGAMFIRNGCAWLDYAATAPAFRRRGSQSAILAARLKRAFELGCERIFTCTGVAAPGDPQHSFGNILKAGFEKDCVRENYAPPE
jgi:GNAT superfamily N-acetyltransferase